MTGDGAPGRASPPDPSALRADAPRGIRRAETPGAGASQPFGSGHLRPILLGLLAMLALFAMPELGVPPASEPGVRLDRGRITALGAVEPTTGQQSATVILIDGPRNGRTVSADVETAGPKAFSVPYTVGEEVIVQTSVTPDGEFVAVTDRWRLPTLYWLLVGFGALVVLVGGWRGIRALIALVLTLGVVVKVVLPLIVAGWDPVLVAVVAATGVTIVTLLLTEGAKRSTAAAAIGTFGALGLTAILAAAVTAAARFSLLQGSEDALYLRAVLGAEFDLGGLLLAAVILGALGVIDDVTITQAATVAELAAADPAAPRSVIAARAMNVGRSHIAATINTLVLAYVAASLPLLLLFAVGRQSPTVIASSEGVAIVIVQTLVGSLGIVAAVPLTTFAAAWLVRR